MTMDYARFNPFPGLRSFEPDEDHLFFGREQRIDELLGRLRRTRFLAVVGTSGSGKSSLVRSGLIPSLYSGFMTRAGSSWRVAVFRPGDDPIGNLATVLNELGVLGMEGDFAETNRGLIEATLRRSSLGLPECVRMANVPKDENLLVLVDQFEELFRFKRNTKIKGSSDDAVAFVNLLLEASRQEEIPVYVVLTMRSDFIGNFTEFRGLAEAVNDGQYLVPRMTREERRAAIVGPVAVGGAEITPRLTLRILNDVGDDPDQLPTMQHALMRTWDYWEANHTEGEPLDLRHYEAIGTIKGALSQHAEEAYRELGDDHAKRISELMFKSLTDKASDNRGVRAPKRLSEICELADATSDEVVTVVDRFRAEGRSFLMPPVGQKLTGDSIIDISHESLMRIWTRLIQWVDEEAQAAQIYLRISKAAAEYQRGEAGLFRDPELQLALNWRQESQPNAVWAERYDSSFDRAMLFLEHSERQRNQELEEKERQRKRQLQWARRLAVILGSAALLTLLFGLYAMVLKMEAEENFQEAVRQKTIADEQRSEAERQKEVADTERVRAEAAQAAAEALQQVGGEQRGIAEEQRQVAVEQKSIAIEQRQRAVESQQEAIRQKSEAEAARELEARAKTEAEQQRQMAVEQKVRAEQSESVAQRLRMLAVARELAVKTSQLVGDEQRELAGLLALQAFRMQQANGGDPADPDLFDALRLSLVRLAPEQARVLRHHKDAIRVLAGAPGSDTAFSGGDDGAIWSFAAGGGATAPRLIGQTASEVLALAVVDGGARVVSGHLDGVIRLWSATTAGLPVELVGHTGGVSALAVSADGAQLVSGAIDGEVRAWPLAGAGAATVATVLKPVGGGRVADLVFVAGDRLAVADAEHGVLLLPATGGSTTQLGPATGVRALAVAADGRLAAGTVSGPIQLYAPDLSSAPAELLGHTAGVVDLAFEAGSTRLASARLDGSVLLWNAADPDHKPIGLRDHDGWVWAVLFVPGGETVVSGSADRTVRLWPTRSEPLADALCQQVTRELTEVEWGEFLPPDIDRRPVCPGGGR